MPTIRGTVGGRLGARLLWGAGLVCGAMAAASAAPPCENVVLVTTDGLRWQELFVGAEEGLIDPEHGGVAEPRLLRQKYWADDPRTRRERLMPFFWRTLAREGQVVGNPDRGSVVRCANGRYFSYPGYSELLCGFSDPSIDSNDKIPNPSASVLEWLNGQPEFAGRVAAFASWDVFPSILNVGRSGIYVNAGWQPLEAFHPSQQREIAQWNRAAGELPRMWEGVRYDLFTFRGAMAYLEAKQPRVLYLALGETDDWCHEGEYDLYLDAARRVDGYLEELWKFLQGSPRYAGKTALLITTDHGRGSGPVGWKSHGAEHPGSDLIWIAGLGPGIPPRGERAELTASQGQVASTLAALAGRDYCRDEPRAAPPIRWQESEAARGTE